MGIHRGPNIEKGGLVFGYDTGHGVCDNHTSSRFYQGKPTTNYLSDGLSSYNVVQGSRWNGATPTFTKGMSEFNTLIGTYNTSGTSYMYSHDYVLDDDLSTLSSQVVTFSIYLRRTDTLGTVGMRIYDNVSGYSTIYADVTGQFQRFSITKTLGANPTRIFVMIDNTNGGIIDFHSPMLEKGKASPFVDGTRSSTESLIDLKRTTDIDLSSMSFDSTGQPTFDGTDDDIDLGSDVTFKTSGGWTVESVARYNSVAGGYNNVTSPANFIGSDSISYNSWYWSVLSGKLALWNISPGVWKYGSTTLQQDTWYHVTIVCSDDGTSYQMYLNGVAEGGDHTTYSWNPSYSGLKIKYIGRGNNSNVRLVNGDIAITKVYGRVLTPEEIKQNFNTYKKRFNI
tara:strand:+ start:239 stop:1426 length:1188 start_codon:yes stop_codon:yes gene_type:complete